MTPIEEVPVHDRQAVEEMLAEADDFAHPWQGDPENDPFKLYVIYEGPRPAGFVHVRRTWRHVELHAWRAPNCREPNAMIDFAGGIASRLAHEGTTTLDPSSTFTGFDAKSEKLVRDVIAAERERLFAVER